MQNQFSFSRFSHLFRKHTSEHLKGYLMSLGVLVGILSLMLGAAAYMSKGPVSEDVQGMLFVLFLFGVGSVFTSNVFANLGQKQRAIAFLTLPATHLEKYLVGWLYSFLLFTIVYTACFYLVDVAVLHLSVRAGQEAELLQMFDTEKRLYLVYLFYAMLHGLFIWGSAFFQKGHFIKTAFTAIILLFVLVNLNTLTMELLWGRELNGAMPFTDISFQEQEGYYTIALPETLERLPYLVPAVLAALFWAAAYKLLQEKQV